MAYATAADLILRKDSRTLGDLVSDAGTRVSEAGLASDTKLAAALDDASGQVDAALLRGGMYQPADLTSLTGNSLAYLKRITCDIAFWLLWERRPAYDDNPRRDAAQERAEEHLDNLRTGKAIFDVPANIEAGKAEITGPSRVAIQDLNLLADRCRGSFYPMRETPHNR